MKKSIIFLTICVLLSLPKNVSAVYFDSDKVYLFENGKPITTSSILWRASYQTYFQICNKGVCDIGQQFYPVTIFKIDESNLLLEEEWKIHYYLEHKGCEGYVTHKNEIEKLRFEYLKSEEYKNLDEEARNEALSEQIPGVAPFVTQKLYDAEVQYIRSKGFPFYENDTCKINNDNYREYLTRLMTTASINNILNPAQSKYGEGCRYLGCIGGSIGNSRALNFDITTGEYSEINPVQIFIMNYVPYVVIFLGLSLIGLHINKTPRSKPTRYLKDN